MLTVSASNGRRQCCTFAVMSSPVNSHAFTAALFEPLALPVSDNATVWQLLMPAGKFTLRDGRGPHISGDAAGMQGVIARSIAFAAGTELMIDYDHQSVFGAIPGVGGRAEAAGWIKELQARADGIYGRIEWTEAAAAKIKAKEYRYISPYYFADDAGHVTRIGNAALVNMPAIGIEAIAASALKSQQESSTMKTIALALGLAESASAETILAAINANQGKIAVAAGLKVDAKLDDVVAAVGVLVADRGRVAVAAGLQADAKPDDVITAVTASVGGAGDMVPKASFDKLSVDFNDLKKSLTSKGAEEAVAAAIDAGKVSPASKAWAMKRATADLADFNEFVANAPVLLGTQLGDKAVTAAAEQDPNAIAASATKYQAEQQAAGRVMSYAEAVTAVVAAGKK